MGLCVFSVYGRCISCEVMESLQFHDFYRKRRIHRRRLSPFQICTEIKVEINIKFTEQKDEIRRNDSIASLNGAAVLSFMAVVITRRDYARLNISKCNSYVTYKCADKGGLSSSFARTI